MTKRDKKTETKNKNKRQRDTERDTKYKIGTDRRKDTGRGKREGKE